MENNFGEKEEDKFQGISGEEIQYFVGDKFDYYIRKWRGAKNPESNAGWNWATFFGGIFWMGYRKIYKYALYVIGLFAAIDVVEILANIKLRPWINYAIWAILAFMGNSIYFKHVKKSIIEIKQKSLRDEENIGELINCGGTSWGGVGIVLLMLIAYAILILLFEYAVKGEINIYR